MTEAPIPDPTFFDRYIVWLRIQGKSETTINNYVGHLKNITGDVEDYFGNTKLQAKKSKMVAYRSYIRFLRKKKLLSSDELFDLLDTFRPPSNKNGHSDRKWRVPIEEYSKYIRRAPNKIAQMGIWLGFNFGLRLGEILHLRVQDVDFEREEVLIRVQNGWHPKNRKEREIPFDSKRRKVLQRWIEEVRSVKILKHDYLLWIPDSPKYTHKGEPVTERKFQRWCKKTGISCGLDPKGKKHFHPHILRYSFATNWYEETKDIKLVCDLLGHSSIAITHQYLQLDSKKQKEKARRHMASF